MSFTLGDIIPANAVRRRPCWRKQGYPSLGAAQAHLRSLLRFPHVHDAHRLNAYRCPHCSDYHVGRLAPVVPAAVPGVQPRG
jgi:hypothetical protein